ncbi:hypothetical protein [Sphingomonas sp. KC8]|uniref:hypothetical protein n=1 Tax=Sphingomonas sp. KC8 TaxID=1030157 RepID=UPI0018DF6390|nr:hypothetical protein [Sphingomonas sp. KC8]
MDPDGDYGMNIGGMRLCGTMRKRPRYHCGKCNISDIMFRIEQETPRIACESALEDAHPDTAMVWPFGLHFPSSPAGLAGKHLKGRAICATINPVFRDGTRWG